MKFRKRSIALVLGAGLLTVLLYSHPQDEPAYLGRPLTAWLEQAGSPSAEGSREACQAVRALGTNALPHLLLMLQAEDSSVQQILSWLWSQQTGAKPSSSSATRHQHHLAQQGFIVLGPIAEPAVPALMPLLNDPRHGARAASALAQIGAVAVLANALAQTNALAQLVAGPALAVIGPDAAPAVPLLVRALQDPNPSVRARAAYALGRIQREAALAVPALTRCLEDEAPDVRQVSAWSLGHFGPLAREAVPALLNGLSEGTVVSESCRRALLQIDHPALVAAGIEPEWTARGNVSELLSLASDTNSLGRHGALQSLRERATEPGKAVPVLVQLLDDPDASIRAAAATALAAYGGQATGAVPDLLRLLNDDEKRVKHAAGTALMQIDPSTAAAHGLK